MKNTIYSLLLAILSGSFSLAQGTMDTLTFEDYTLDPMTGYFNGSTLPDGTTSYTYHNFTFDISYTNWGGGWYSWFGFSVSNHTDSVTPGHYNQYSAYPTHGSNNSEKYGVAYLIPEDYSVPAAVYGGQKIVFDTVRTLKSMDITNTTYAIKSMRHGDSFGKIFGSPNDTNGIPDGTNGKDWFWLKIVPLNENDQLVGDTITFYLADFRFDDPAQNYMIEDWVTVSLNNVQAKKMQFFTSSSDVGMNGLNTPAYFAFDNLITQKCAPNTVAIDSILCSSQLPFTWNNQTISVAGIYTDTQNSANGCDSTTTLNVTVLPTIEVVENNVVCDSELPFSWNGQTILQQGTYTHVETATSGCDSTTILNVTVHPNIAVTIDSTINENELPFIWNGQSISQNGTYTHTEIGSNGCDSTTTLNVTINFNAINGIAQIEMIQFSAYPNPATDRLTVEINQKANLQLIDAVGQSVLRQIVDGTMNINVNQLPKGCYFLSINTDEGTATQKIIIQ